MDLKIKRQELIRQIAEQLGMAQTKAAQAQCIADLSGIKPASVFPMLYGQNNLGPTALEQLKSSLSKYQWAREMNLDLLGNPNGSATPVATPNQQTPPARKRGRPSNAARLASVDGGGGTNPYASNRATTVRSFCQSSACRRTHAEDQAARNC